MDVQRFVDFVRTWEGVPHHHQGRTRFGVDCVGLAVAGLREQGVEVEDSFNYAVSATGKLLLAAIDKTGLVEPVSVTEAVCTGDILVFRVARDPQHLAIAVDSGRIIHATSPEGVCCVTFSPMWRSRLVARYTWR